MEFVHQNLVAKTFFECFPAIWEVFSLRHMSLMTTVFSSEGNCLTCGRARCWQQLKSQSLLTNLDAKYKQILLNNNPHYHRERQIAAINAKDIAEPKDLHDPKACTFIKMTRPCFSSFPFGVQGTRSPECALGDQIRERFYSRIDSVRIEGGYFDGLTANLSGHLETVIGGRGTGKSTLLECLRYALDVPH